jgi:hypothetical protein
MFSNLLDKIGEWNPQLYREIKGRFTSRNLILTIGCALITNYLLILVFSSPAPGAPDFKSIFNTINWLVPIILTTCGTYQLSFDLAKEYQKRTINFITFTPQPSQKILLGKILGVPCLIYLGIALFIPSHLFSGLALGVSFLTIISVYGFWLAGCFLFYNLAIFGVISANGQQSVDSKYYSPENISGFAASAGLILGFMGRASIDFLVYHPSGWHWFGLPLGEVKALAYIWALSSLIVTSYWLWNAINRRFYSKDKSLLGKGQVYQLVTYSQLWIIGFVFPGQYAPDDWFEIFGLGFVFLFNSFLYLIMLWVSAPSRQYILDWTRYNHLERKNRGIYLDLMFSEKSPVTAAVFLSCAITLIIWLSWFLLLPEVFFTKPDWLSRVQMIIALVLQVNVWLIYAAIADIIFFREKPQKYPFKQGATVFVMAVASALLVSFVVLVLRINLPWLWAFTLFPIAVYLNGSTVTACLGLFLQLVTLVLVGKKFLGTIKELGKSETKVLLEDGRLP